MSIEEKIKKLEELNAEAELGGLLRYGIDQELADEVRALMFVFDDLVLVAGKGHEDYQEIGGRRRAYSDIEQVEQVLQGGAA